MLTLYEFLYESEDYETCGYIVLKGGMYQAIMYDSYSSSCLDKSYKLEDVLNTLLEFEYTIYKVENLKSALYRRELNYDSIYYD